MKELLNIFNYSLLIYCSRWGNKPTNPNLCSPDEERQRNLTMHSWAYLQKETNRLYPKPVCEPCKPSEVQSSHQQNQYVHRVKNQDMFHHDKQQNLQSTLWGSPSSSSGCKTSGQFNQHRGEVDVPWDACQAIPSVCRTFLCQTRASHGHGELSFPKESSAKMVLTVMDRRKSQFDDLSGELGLFTKIYLFQLQSKGQGMKGMPTALKSTWEQSACGRSSAAAGTQPSIRAPLALLGAAVVFLHQSRCIQAERPQTSLGCLLSYGKLQHSEDEENCHQNGVKAGQEELLPVRNLMGRIYWTYQRVEQGWLDYRVLRTSMGENTSHKGPFNLAGLTRAHGWKLKPDNSK